MMRPVVRSACALILMTLGVKAFAAPSAVTIGTGPVAGFSFPLGGEICRLYEQALPAKKNCTVGATDGSAEDLKRLRAGEDTLAIVQSDAAADAMTGSGAFAGTPAFVDLRALAGFYSNALTVLVRSDGPVRKVEDLKGKRLLVGEPGMRDQLFSDYLEGLGWSRADLGGIVEMPRNEQIAALCSGMVAAVIITAPHPNGFVRQALSACPLIALDLSGAGMDATVGAHPAYAAGRIDMSVYGNAAYSFGSFGPRAVLVTTVKLDDETVIRLLTGIFGHLDDMRKAHPAFAGLDPEVIYSDLGLGAPQHRAALKYFAEHKPGESTKGE
jgi:TRAP transporter TAXI family solute receptor